MTRAEVENLDELDELTDTDELETDEALADAENEPEFLPFLPPSLFGGRSRSPRVGGRQNYYRPRPMANFVTQTQLQAALTRVRSDVRTNATAIKGVNSRINGVEARQAKNNAQQAKQIAVVKNDLKKTREMNLIMFLLTRPKTSDTVTTEGNVAGATVPVGSKIVYESGTGNSMLLPLLLMGGLGGDGGSDSSMGNVLLPLLLLTGGLGG